MTPAGVSAVVGRIRPRRVRTRLDVFYIILFLLAGAVLLALTYALLASVLLPASPPLPKKLTPQEAALMILCKPLPSSRSLLAQCNRLIYRLGPGPAAREHTLAELRSASLIALGVLASASAALGWLASGRALRPVRSITEAAKQASELRLGQRLALTGPDDEFKQLADTFDVMLERLEAAFTSQKRFVANAAHELRTPLTAMRTAIEVTLSKPTRTAEQLEAMAARVKRSVEQAEATVEALLALATSELGPTVQEAVDLATAAEDALDAAHPTIDQRHLTVEAALEPAVARGDRVLLERMIANLVENAMRHNNPDGWIGIRTSQQSDSAVFEIANSGTSVPAEQIPYLFELALLGEDVRSASVRARRDSALLKLGRDAFEALIYEAPSFALGFARAMGRELAASRTPITAAVPPRRIAVIGLDSAAPTADVAEGLSEALARLGSVASLSASEVSAIDQAEHDADRVLLRGSSTPDEEWTGLCVREADVVVAVTTGTPDRAWMERAAALKGCELLVFGPPAAAVTLDELEPHETQVVSDMARQRDALEATARRLAGRSLGIVFSGGGRAGSHISARCRSCARRGCALTASAGSASARSSPRRPLQASRPSSCSRHSSVDSSVTVPAGTTRSRPTHCSAAPRLGGCSPRRSGGGSSRNCRCASSAKAST